MSPVTGVDFWKSKTGKNTESIRIAILTSWAIQQFILLSYKGNAHLCILLEAIKGVAFSGCSSPKSVL